MSRYDITHMLDVIQYVSLLLWDMNEFHDRQDVLMWYLLYDRQDELHNMTWFVWWKKIWTWHDMHYMIEKSKAWLQWKEKNWLGIIGIIGNK